MTRPAESGPLESSQHPRYDARESRAGRFRLGFRVGSNSTALKPHSGLTGPWVRGGRCRGPILVAATGEIRVINSEADLTEIPCFRPGNYFLEFTKCGF